MRVLFALSVAAVGTPYVAVNTPEGRMRSVGSSTDSAAPGTTWGVVAVSSGVAMMRRPTVSGWSSAATSYEALTDDERLSLRDRTRARLWVGTSLTKKGTHDYAVQVMATATRAFEELEEPEDWSVAHQKLALAYRGAGDLGNALRYIDVALSNRSADSPMQRVRLDTAHAHILLSDTATQGNGLTLLDQTARLSRDVGLSNQLRSIEGIRHSFERQAR